MYKFYSCFFVVFISNIVEGSTKFKTLQMCSKKEVTHINKEMKKKIKKEKQKIMERLCAHTSLY